MKKQFIFVLGAILIAGAVAATLLFNMHQKSVRETERKTVERLITTNGMFSVCKIYKLKFVRLKRCTQDDGSAVCNLPQHHGACFGGSFCNLSELSEAATTQDPEVVAHYISV